MNKTYGDGGIRTFVKDSVITLEISITALKGAFEHVAFDWDAKPVIKDKGKFAEFVAENLHYMVDQGDGATFIDHMLDEFFVHVLEGYIGDDEAVEIKEVLGDD